mmetsp:Transcript_53965/g.152071  ORF Transcript_53965/g.152071 Transcript_53965/m.152071 type:complete len:137 (-) Transcript_53965:314-724(-)
MDTAGSRHLAHTLSWGMNLSAFASMLTFVAVKTPGKRGHLPLDERWGPFACLLIATLLVMIDPTRHIFLDANMFVATLHMFNPDGTLTSSGRIGQLGAWIGNVMMFASLLWFVLPPGCCRSSPPQRRGASQPLNNV